MTSDTNTFWERLHVFGYWKLIQSKDFISAVILFCILYILAFFEIITMTSGLIGYVFNISLALVAIVLAGFAIIISFTDIDYILFLDKAQVYKNILFKLEYNIYLQIIVFCISLSYITLFNNLWLYWLIILIFIYSILSLLYLISLISSLGLKKVDFVKITKSKK